jgi:hypothetical protein
MERLVAKSPYLVGNSFTTMTNRFGLNSVPPSYRQGFDTHSLVLDIKGKGKFKETDLDAAFARAASSLEIVPAKVEPQSSGTSDPVDDLDDLETVLGEVKLDDEPLIRDEGIYQLDFKRFVGSNVSTI